MNTKHERTSQYSLTLALDCILRMSIATKSKLRNVYNLHQNTILKIEDGHKLSPSAHQRYLQAFVGIINSYRCMHHDQEDDMNKVLADIMLAECGIRTDAEKAADYDKKKRTEYMKSICSTKL